MEAVYVKSIPKKDKDKLREQQKTLKEAMIILDIDEYNFYNLIKKGPEPVCNNTYLTLRTTVYNI